MNTEIFNSLKFTYPFYRHQELILNKFEADMKNDTKSVFKFHVVAPPGSGKTVVGLEMAIRLKYPAIILCPNTAIQGQWADKIKLFINESCQFNRNDIVSTDTKDVRLINSFTYQSLSLPDTSDESIDNLAQNLWAEEISASHGINIQEALQRIVKMKNANFDDYNKELSKYRKKIRNKYLKDPNVNFLDLLHPNTIEILDRLKKLGTKTMIFDECHHLQSYWAVIMESIINYLEIKNVIGLTATPPLGEDKAKLEAYTNVLGEIDYMIPTPAIVKQGKLAPYQDLVRICVPTEDEFDFIKNCQQKFNDLIKEFNKEDSDFYFWIQNRILNRKLATGESQEWSKFINSRPKFGTAGVKYLIKHNYKLPWDITITENMYEDIYFEDWCELIEDFSLNFLKVSNKDNHILLYQEIRQAIRNLGLILTENGIKGYSSPVDRILAYSKSKVEAVKEILKKEMNNMGDKLRVAIITDFEFSDSLYLKKIENIMDEETGGAINVIKKLTMDSMTDKLDPVIVTSQNLICDDDLAEKYVEMGNVWAKENNLNVLFQVEKSEKTFAKINGSGKDWSPKSAVLFTTFLLEQGVTKCIIGTRGLLGEGWDSLSLNTLIDLTTVTTFASVNQLRGRSIRKSNDKNKVANNWDIICIAPDLEKGYNDWERLYNEHNQFYGLSDDGQIQKGINHLSSSVIFDKKYLSQDKIKRINNEMLKRASQREKAYEMWKIGEDFNNEEVGCFDVILKKPPKNKDTSITLKERLIFNLRMTGNVMSCAGSVGCVIGAATIAATSIGIVGLGLGAAVLGLSSIKGFKSTFEFGKNNFINITTEKYIKDIAKAILFSLRDMNEVSLKVSEEDINIKVLQDGSYRVFLNSIENESRLFVSCISEIIAPIEDQRYVIERYEIDTPESSIGRIFYMIEYGLNIKGSLIKYYHPLPKLFSTKHKAKIFKKYWNSLVSPGEIVFLKGKNGTEIVEKYGRTNVFEAVKNISSIWR